MIPWIVIDLDWSKKGAFGQGHIFTNSAHRPSFAFDLHLNTNRKQFVRNVELVPFDAIRGRALDLYELNSLYPEEDIPKRIQLNFRRIDRDHLEISWPNAEDGVDSVIAERSRPPSRSHLEPESEVYSWDTFRTEMAGMNFRDFVYRGQSKPYSLQTTFHRTKRKNLLRYLSEDVRNLHQSVVGSVRHIFNTDIPQDLGALLNLAQHHGFPTPLLDWTYSPFVAAWFAFEQVEKKRLKKLDHEDCTRVYCLDIKSFRELRYFVNLTLTVPHTSIVDALPIENNRAIPQQGVLMSTNMQDIEAHLFNLSQVHNIEYLRAFDIPAFYAGQALNDLAMMGITRTTMMPGLDSICRDLKNRLFG